MLTIRDMLAVPNEPVEEMKSEINSLLSKVVIHSNRPIENLPLFPVPELKIIGRCVTFTAETVIGGKSKKYHYEGLVNIITKKTVTLMNVYRFTDEDFLMRAQKQKCEVEMNTMITNKNDFEKSEGNTLLNDNQPQSKLPVGNDMTGQMVNNATDDERQVASSEPIGDNNDEIYSSPTCDDIIVKDDGKNMLNSRNKLQFITGSYGPIPYMTFVRSHIHNVEFARDPASSFYSLFRDPSREIFDMQCLRMFVRRYLVHTSQGNNPRQIPLRAFVTCRCNCPDLSKDLLRKVTFEELITLCKICQEIKYNVFIQERKRLNEIIEYRAPSGMYSNTGALFVTSIPQHTFRTGIGMIIMTILFIIYFAVIDYWLDLYIFRKYFHEFVPYYIVTAVGFALCDIITILHSLKMSIHLSRHMALLCARLVLTIIAVLLAIGVLVCSVLVIRLYGLESFVEKKLSDADICSFMNQYNCAGYKDFCNKRVRQPPFCVCPQYEKSEGLCHDKFRVLITTPVIAGIAIAILFLILGACSIYLLYRLWSAMRVVVRLNKNMLRMTSLQINSSVNNDGQAPPPPTPPPTPPQPQQQRRQQEQPSSHPLAPQQREEQGYEEEKIEIFINNI